MRRTLLILLRVVMALALALVGLWYLALPEAPGPFYTPDGPLPDRPGVLLAAEGLDRDLPPGSKGWRILYSTTRPDGRIVASSGVVVAPLAAPEPLPVIGYAHGTTGVADGCAPSSRSNPFSYVPGYPHLLRRGWAYVATDYAGLGTPEPHYYLVGEDAGRATLDAVRAAREIEGLELAGDVTLWGHSQGGHAALWAGQLAPDYAPELNIVGVAAGAPASDLPALVEATEFHVLGRILTAYLAAGYTRAYPELQVENYMTAQAEGLVADMQRRCLGILGTAISAVQSYLLPGSMFARPPTSGAMGERLAQNTPRGPIRAPVLVGQGGQDELVPQPMQANYVAARCADGQRLEYRVYPQDDHLSLVATDSAFVADLLAWTARRFQNLAALKGCPESQPPYGR